MSTTVTIGDPAPPQKIGRLLGAFWLTYIASFYALSYCFTAALIPSEGFYVVAFDAFILTGCGILCGQVLRRSWALLLSAVALAAGTVVGLFWLFTLDAWLLLIPLIVPSIGVGIISKKSRYVFFWGFLAGLLPSVGLLGLVILDNRIRLGRW
jgi:hypothetical protein